MISDEGVFNATAIIPTRNRSSTLRTTLASLARQSMQPRLVIIVDGSESDETARLIDEIQSGVDEWSEARYETRIERAVTLGAATQRNQGMEHAVGDAILFMDDDLIFEPGCVDAMQRALQSDDRIGAAGATLTNQSFEQPGMIWNAIYKWLGAPANDSLAGRCFGPAIMMLPSDDLTLPEIVPVDWMPTCCALYRRSVLPTPLFNSFFTGYSYMEDAALALTVARRSRLVNARNARVFHDSQPGEHKADVRALSRMEMINRHYVLTDVMRDTRASSFRKLIFFETARVFSLLLSRKTRRYASRAMRGKFAATMEIMQTRREAQP